MATETTYDMPYRLGLPAWAFPGWKGRYFHEKPSMLASYASTFNAVEGNTTFYGTPGEKTVQSWRDAVAGTEFRFCFKLPRDITHERFPDLKELSRFLTAIEPVGEHIGPLLVQFPARLGPDNLSMLETLFSELSGDYQHVVEVRHPKFFEQPNLLEPLLEKYGCGRVVLDSRALYEGDLTHPDVLKAVHEKPDLPILPRTYNDIAFIRLVLHPDRLDNDRYIDEWAARVAAWITRKQSVYVTIHCPNNLHCPELAMQFHQSLRSRMPGLSPLPPWPVPQQGELI